MIYLKTSVGIELRGEDMLLSSLQANFSGGAFTHFKRIANYQACNKEDLKREINQFFKSNGLSKDHVVLGITRKDILLRYLDFPSEVEDNLKQVVQYQVKSFEPTEESNYYYDHVLLSNNAATKKLNVLLAMVRKTFLDEQLQTLREIDIRPMAVVGSSMGLTNLFIQNQKDLNDKTLILADLNSSGFELVAVHNGAFAYSREAPRESGQSWSDALLREVSEAASRMRLASDSALEKIVVAGESSESALEEIKTGIPDCELLKNSVGFTMTDETKEHIQEASSSLGLAYTGMARRPFIKMNLLPSELRVRQTRWAYVPTVVLGLAIIALLGWAASYKIVINQRIYKKLDAESHGNNRKVKAVNDLRGQLEELDKKVKGLEDLIGKRDLNLDILKELTEILPPDTYLNNFINRDGVITLVGLSGSSSDLIQKLDQSPYFKDVVMKAPIRAQGEKDLFNYELKLEK